MSRKTYSLPSKENTIIELVEGDTAINLLKQIDQFVSNMSPFDMQVRMRSTTQVTLDQYINFVSSNIVNWETKYEKLFESAIKKIAETSYSANILKCCSFPSKIYIVLTTGAEECDAAYCRNNNVIVMPKTCDEKEWEKTVPHELFHIWSRNNISLRNQLYETIGYYTIPGDVSIFPLKLKDHKITNPDAPTTKHYIKLCCKESPTTEVCLAPILLTETDYCDAKLGLFDCLKTMFVALDEKSYEPIDGKVYSYDDVYGLLEKIGSNTDYIIHPEEVLADNFVLLLHENKNLTSPIVVENLKKILTCESADKKN